MAEVFLPNNLNSKESTAMTAKTKTTGNIIDFGSLLVGQQDAFRQLLREPTAPRSAGLTPRRRASAPANRSDHIDPSSLRQPRHH